MSLDSVREQFQRAVSSGIRKVWSADKAPPPDPAEVRMDIILDWLGRSRDGRDALAEELQARLQIAKEAQRVNLESHPEIAYAMGLQDGLQQVMDLCERAGQAENG